MYARVVLGVGKGVLFREVSSVQSPHITTRPRSPPVGDGRNLAFIHITVLCEGIVAKRYRWDLNTALLLL